jgi:propanol-preferring alcohol dehydrogenase
MKAAILTASRSALEVRDVPDPVPGPGQVLVRVTACAVCRTDLHIVDGELPAPRLPLILGHRIVGVVERTGPRVGVPWRTAVSASRFLRGSMTGRLLRSCARG